MSAAEYASSKILPRFQNSRTNVISVTFQDSSLEKLEKLSSFTYLPSTMAAKKFRPSFFRHFKKIDVVHSLLSL
jgi:hypothetical protein